MIERQLSISAPLLQYAIKIKLLNESKAGLAVSKNGAQLHKLCTRGKSGVGYAPNVI